jgi:hypothetical protein
MTTCGMCSVMVRQIRVCDGRSCSIQAGIRHDRAHIVFIEGNTDGTTQDFESSDLTVHKLCPLWEMQMQQHGVEDLQT